MFTAGPIPLRIREARVPIVNDNECVRKINTVKNLPPEEWPMRLKALCDSYSDVLVDELKSNE